MNLQIIAELAQGFEGKPEQARLLLKAAAAAGADAAKYQLVYADELATPDYKHHALFRTLEMPDEVWRSLASHASELGVALQFDIFGPRSLALAEQLGVSAVKLHPTDVTNAGLLRAVAQSRIGTVLLGAGGARKSELAAAVRALASKDVVILLGYQGYPTPTDTNQIDRVRLLKQTFGAAAARVRIGFADHGDPKSSLSHALATTAIGAGACVLEKHLTLGQIMKLEDHESALNPDEFAEFVSITRSCAAAIASADDREDFGMSEAEQAYRRAIRRHVVTARAIPADHALAPEDLTLRRTAAANPLLDLADAYGRRLRVALPAGAAVQNSDLV
jgi:N,N'-diacetyllegionaminate synthase